MTIEKKEKTDVYFDIIMTIKATHIAINLYLPMIRMKIMEKHGQLEFHFFLFTNKIKFL